jgi:sterol desaturase/sphingolipid hydroxylase (fatty acid hydroxylase superfamily)
MLESALRLGFSLGTFVAMASAEYVAPRRQLAEPRRRRWPVNLGFAFLNSAILRMVGGGAVVSAAVFAGERGTGLLQWVSLPPWAGWAITILTLDLVVYLQHVMFHAVPIFWRLHRMHHADLGFDTSTGFRFHPIEILASAVLKSAVAVLLGAVPWAVVAFEILLNATSLFNHGNVHIPERVDAWLRRLVVTPDMHRIHHSMEVVETNSNFGFSFSFWDRLCGTYRQDPKLGQLGLEIGLSEFRTPLGFGDALLLPFKGSAGRYTFEGKRMVGVTG